MMFKLDIKLDPELLEKIKQMQAELRVKSYAHQQRPTVTFGVYYAPGTVIDPVEDAMMREAMAALTKRFDEMYYVRPSVIDATATVVNDGPPRDERGS